jgi:hypothetical protein
MYMLTVIAMTLVALGLMVSIDVLPSSAQNNATTPSLGNQTSPGDYNMTMSSAEEDQSGAISSSRGGR